MELPQISLITALLATTILGLGLILRGVFSRKFAGKEFQIAVGRNWDKVKYLTYLFVIFFVVCSVFIALMILEMFSIFSYHGLLHVLELVIDLLLLLIGLDLLWLITLVLWSDGK